MVKRLAFPMKGTVDLWTIDLDHGFYETEVELSDAETALARRFHFERDQTRWRNGRKALRSVLSRYCSLRPHQIDISTAENGKPFLDDGRDLSFNTSRSGRYCVIAIAMAMGVGVDIETERSDTDFVGVVEEQFSPAEQDRLAGLEGSTWRNAFFRIWTAKEAAAKVKGEGLSAPFGSWTVEEKPELDISRGQDDPPLWLLPATGPSGTIITIACDAPLIGIQYRTL